MIRVLLRITELVAACILASIVAILFAQIISRYVFRISLSWPEEIARYLLVWLVFIGGAAAIGAGQQLVVDMLTEFASRRMKRVIRIVAAIGGLLGLAILVYTALPLFGPAARTVSPASGLPLFWVYLALPVGSAIAAIFLLDELFRDLTGKSEPRKPAADQP